MKIALGLLISVGLLGVSSIAVAQSGPKVGIDACARTVLAKYPGNILQVVLKKEKNEMVWEVEVQQKDKLLDIECSARTGKIVETETRVISASDDAFKAKAKISEDEARKIAQAKYPGEVEYVEYEIESNGLLSYEFDIKTEKGDMRVEVDAETGKIVEASQELLEIGQMRQNAR
jgi:uncharacterized membrane protein YkoI